MRGEGGGGGNDEGGRRGRRGKRGKRERRRRKEEGAPHSIGALHPHNPCNGRSPIIWYTIYWRAVIRNLQMLGKYFASLWCLALYRITVSPFVLHSHNTI